MKSSQNPGRLLTRSENDYLKCLKLKKAKLDELLRQDEEFWIENLRNAKKEAEMFEEQIRAVMERCRREIQGLMTRQPS